MDGRPAAATDGIAHRRATTLGLFTLVVAVAFEAISVATAMPAAARDLDGLGLYAWAFSLFLIGQLFATVAAGRLCDRMGPARPMAGGAAVFALGLGTAATAGTMEQLVAGRLLQGLGAGAVSVAMYVVIARVYDAARRPALFSYISSAWVVPSFVGPAVAAWLTHHLGWRSVFWIDLPLLAIGALMVLPPVLRAADGPDPSASPTGPAASVWAAALAAVGAAAVQLAGQRPDLPGLAAGVVGVALLAVGLPRLLPPGFFRFRPGLAPVVVVRMTMAGGFFGAEAFVPLMLVEQRHLSLLVAGSSLTLGALGWSLGSWVAALPRLPLRRSQLITLGAGFVSLGTCVVAAVAWLQPWVGLVAVGWTVAGLGMGLATSGTSVAIMTLSRPGDQGRNASSLQFGEAFGAGLFVGVGGTVFAALRPAGPTPTFGWVLTAMAVVTTTAVLVSLRVGSVRAHPLTRHLFGGSGGVSLRS